MRERKRTREQERAAEMVKLIARHDLAEGFTPTALPAVRLMHSTRYVASCPVIYEPSIVVIAQGRKIGRVGGQTFIYDTQNYLALSVPLPFDCETFATPEAPLYGVSIRVAPALIGELALLLDDEVPSLGPPGRGVEAAPVCDRIARAVIRLLECLASPMDARVLGPQYAREIVYHALLGPIGANLRAQSSPDSHYGRICRALQRMQTSFREPIEIERLAREMGMSATTFHQRFKAIAGASPLQYLKAVRLQRARLLMASEGATAAAAAEQVGYESASQFNREFKRYFGGTPRAVVDDIKKSRLQLA